MVDRLSGLMWPRDAGLMSLPSTWAEAYERIAELNSEGWGGHSDWRLPTRSELFTLVSHAQINPALPAGHLFENVFPGYYWTATSCSRFPRQAWYVHLGGGRIFRGMKHGSYLVWPVRTGLENEDGGKPPSADQVRFQRREEAVFDRLTGLLWYAPAPTSKGTTTWQTALDRVKGLNRRRALGHGNWRLPNVRELESLIDPDSHSPAIYPDNPLAEELGDGYWSSTTSVYDAAYGWVIYTQNGEVGVGYKAHPEFHVMAVR
ncbi:MAG: Lcl C-terminal domain-containing protein [Desulfobacterales bacterium]